MKKTIQLLLCVCSNTLFAQTLLPLSNWETDPWRVLDDSKGVLSSVTVETDTNTIARLREEIQSLQTPESSTNRHVHAQVKYALAFTLFHALEESDITQWVWLSQFGPEVSSQIIPDFHYNPTRFSGTFLPEEIARRIQEQDRNTAIFLEQRRFKYTLENLRTFFLEKLGWRYRPPCSREVLEQSLATIAENMRFTEEETAQMFGKFHLTPPPKEESGNGGGL